MKITRASEYAIRCVYFMVSHKNGIIIKKNKLAQEMEIPEQFLTKITQQLARSGIITIVQGPKGGLKLLKNPEQITLLDVVESIMGKLFLNECIQYSKSCKRQPDCKIHLVWQKAQQNIRETLKKANFESLTTNKPCISKLFEEN